MHETGCSVLVHWDDPEGWGGEGGGRGVQDGEHMYTRGVFMSVYGKSHYNWSLQFKKKKKNLPAMQKTWVLIPGLGSSPGGGHGNPL